MEKRLDLIEEEISSIKDDVKAIKEALLGNAYSSAGLIHTLKEHEQKITQITKQIDRFKWIIIGLSMGSGVAVYEIIKTVFKI